MEKEADRQVQRWQHYAGQLDAADICSSGVDVSLRMHNARQSELEIKHVFVDPRYQGKGIAAKLTKEIFSMAQELRCQVVPTCSYVSDTFLVRNPAYLKDILGQCEEEVFANADESRTHGKAAPLESSALTSLEIQSEEQNVGKKRPLEEV
jgi:predicted GNAT family acetyltransferase